MNQKLSKLVICQVTNIRTLTAKTILPKYIFLSQKHEVEATILSRADFKIQKDEK